MSEFAGSGSASSNSNAVDNHENDARNGGGMDEDEESPAPYVPTVSELRSAESSNTDQLASR